MNTTFADNFPTISVGIKYGQYVDNFEPDIAFLTTQMRAGGLSEEEISKTRIEFSDESNPNKNGLITHGFYNHRKKFIKVYGIDDLKQESKDTTGSNVAARVMSETLVHELEHRIASADPEQRNKNWHYKNKLFFGKRSLAFGMGALALSQGLNIFNEHILHSEPHFAKGALFAVIAIYAARKAENVIFKEDLYNEYVDSPEEQRVRAVAAQHTDKLVISLKKEA